MTFPIAIYRPRTRSLLLANDAQSIIVDEDRVLRLAGAFRQLAAMIGPRSLSQGQIRWMTWSGSRRG